MPYFLILPAFVVYVGVMSVVLIVTTVHQPAAHLRRPVSSVLIWSSAGFVASTVIYAIVFVVSARAMNQILDGQPSVVGGVVMGGLIFIAPFIAAALGLVGGGAFGLWRSLRAPRRARRVT